MFSGDQSFQSCLTEEVAAAVSETVQYIRDLTDSLASGSINVASVQWLMGHQQQFHEVIRTVLTDSSRALLALRLRLKELEKYENAVQEVTGVLEWCKSIIKTGELLPLSLIFLHSPSLNAYSSMSFRKVTCYFMLDGHVLFEKWRKELQNIWEHFRLVSTRSGKNI